MNLKKVDLSLFFLAFGFTFFSAYQLFFAKQEHAVPSREVVATLEKVGNTVMKKRFDFLAWFEAGQQEQLVADDLIYTHQDSFAQVRYKSGVTVDVAQNTLFKIVGGDSADTVELEAGSLVANMDQQSQSLNILMGERSYRLESEQATLGIRRDEGLINIMVMEGKAAVTSSTGVRKELKKRDFLQVDEKTGGQLLGTMAISLIYPKSNQQIYINALPFELLLEWESQEENTPVKIEIARDQNFEHIIKTARQSAQQLALSLAEEGTYFWKVELLKKDKKNAQIIMDSFHLVFLQPPKALSPQNDDLFVPKAEDAQFGVLFQWAVDHKAEHRFEIEVVNEKEKKWRQESDDAFIEKKLPLGNYRWRVRSLSEDESSVWSEFKSFSIASPPLPPAPNFIFPEHDISIEFFEPHIPEDYQLPLRWEKKGSSYNTELRFSHQSDESLFIEEDHFLWKPQRYGHYKIDLRAIDPYQRQTAFGSQRRVEFIDRSSDVVDEKLQVVRFELSKPDQEVNFQWESQKGQTYHFTLARDKAMKDVIRRVKSKKAQLKLNFPQTGTFYWQVKSDDVTKPYLKPVKVEVSPTPPPEKPKLQKPLKIQIRRRQTSNSLLNKAKTLVGLLSISSAHAANDQFYAPLQWDVDQEAKEYIVEIYRDPQARDLVLREVVEKNNYEWKNPQVGTFYWRIAVVDYWQRQSPFSDLSSLEILPPEQRKVRQKSKQKKQKVIQKKVVKKKPTPPKLLSSGLPLQWWQVAWLPSSVTYESKAQNYQVDTSGGIVSGFFLSWFKRLEKKKLDVDLSMTRLMGQSFNDINFVVNDFLARLYYRYSEGLKFGTGFIYSSLPHLTASSNQVQEGSLSALAPLASVMGTWSHAKGQWQAEASLWFAKQQGQRLSLEYWHEYKKSSFLIIGAQYTKRSFEYQNHDSKIDEATLKLGYAHGF